MVNVNFFIKLLAIISNVEQLIVLTTTNHK